MDFSQTAGQNFQDWEGANQLAKLLDKLKNYCGNSLKYWQHQRIGKQNNTVLEIYGSFPPKSDFVCPKHVPHDVLWARFRLEWDARLIGFVIPSEHHGKIHKGTSEGFDCNTFYVVFLDKNHKFWKNER